MQNILRICALCAEDNTNLSPSTGGACFEIMEESDYSDESDPETEMLVEVEARKHLEGA